MTKLAIVDTETTGLDPERHEIWEVALLLADSGDLTEPVEYTWYLPVDLTRADPMGLRVSGYHDRHPAGYGSDADLSGGGSVHSPFGFAAEFCHLTYQAHIVGAVPSFDDERLRKLLSKHGYAPGWHYHLIDVEAMAVGYLHGALREVDGDRQFPRPSLPWRSDDLSRECGVDPPSEDERHTALGDARWAWRWYRALVGDGVDREYVTFGTTRSGGLHENG